MGVPPTKSLKGADMKYLVLIDSRSMFGKAFSDVYESAKIGQETHLQLDCDQIDLSNVHYTYVHTCRTTAGNGNQSLHIPHSAVLFVVQYAEGQKPQIGFV